jgi:hypothetical protein
MKHSDYFLVCQSTPFILHSDNSVFGPGSILGWSLTVMGSELPASMEEEREYIRCRWGGIHGLGLKHSFKAAELLEVCSLHYICLLGRKFGDERIGRVRLGDRPVHDGWTL